MDFRDIVLDSARLATSIKYQQLRVEHADTFTKTLRLRGIDLHLDVLWAIGACRPVAIDDPERSLRLSKSLVPLGDQEDRFLADVRTPARELYRGLRRARAPFAAAGNRAWYHSFQVWTLYLINRRMQSIVGVMNPLGSKAGHLRIVELNRRAVRRSLSEFMRSWDLVDALRLEQFLIAVAPLVFWHISGRIVAVISDGEKLDQYWSWRSDHDPISFMSDFNLSISDLRRWHKDLSTAAMMTDPLQSWFPLLRNLAYEKWGKLHRAGSVLLANDLHVMVQILRLYSSEYLALDLPDEDAVIHGPYIEEINEREYGSRRVTHGNREVRREIAREFGIDGSARVLWLVEGPTEVWFIKEYCRLAGMDYHEHGIELFDLEGKDWKKDTKLKQLLRGCGSEGQFTYFSMDALPDVARRLRVLAEAQLITGGFDLWKTDFEAANFTDDELASVLNEMADSGGQALGLSGDDVRSARKEGADTTEKAIVAVCKGKHSPFKKGRALGVKLAAWAFDHPRDEESDRPVLDTLGMLWRACTVDFLYNVRNFRVTSDGKLERIEHDANSAPPAASPGPEV